MTPTPLPIDSCLAEILTIMRETRNLILTATPGAGKTTRLPPELLKIAKNRIIVLQPRRMAAVAACERVAEERGWAVGREVGYQVRFATRVTSETRLIYMTDALLLRKLLEDPELSGIDMVVIDEFHERGLNQDLLLGALRELQEMGSSISVVVMSATLDAGRLLAFLPGARHFDVPGLVYPLEIRHLQSPLRQQTDSIFYERVVNAVQVAVRETDGDVLVFLPGQGEIAQALRRLEGRVAERTLVALHGSLPLAKQREVLQAPSHPRVILATNVAEASVTVQGVDYVIDTGVAKVMRMNPHSGFSTLELTRISQFNARQRAGRAARQKPGVCVRMWTVHEEATQLQEMPPEAQRADLAQALLMLAHLGVRDFALFAWLDAPPKPLLEICSMHLQRLGALDAEMRLTELGRTVLRFPLEARWGAFLSLADLTGVGRMGSRVCALLSERDIVGRDDVRSGEECDLQYRLHLLEEFSVGRSAPEVDRRAAQQVLEGSRQLESLLRHRENPAQDPVELLPRLLLATQRDRLCRRRGESAKALMVGGRGVRLAEQSQVRESGFFIALQGVDLSGQPETMVSLACGVSKALILDELKDQVQIDEQVQFIEEKSEFFARRTRTVEGLPLEEPTLTPVAPDQVLEQLAQILTGKWDWLAVQNEALGRWLMRWRFLLRFAPQYSEHLQELHIGEALALAAFGKTSVTEVVAENLVGYLEQSMDSAVVALLHAQVPEKFTAPSGSALRIEYESGHTAYVDVRLQEIFGLTSSPSLVFGQLPLTFRLLAPNYRPVQVTSDLQNFWRVGYLEVRKELRTRYPKHAWPDNPLTARPEAKGRRRQEGS